MLDDLPSLAPKLLLALQKSGHLTAAAQSLNVSQPAASKALQRSEALLGVALIKRGERPIALTAEGILLAEYAKQQQGLAHALSQRIQGMKNSGVGTLRIASFGASASTHLLPRLIERLASHLPALTVNILEFNPIEAIKALEDGYVDFATAVLDEDDQFEYLPLAKDRLVALVPACSPLAKRSSLSAADLSNVPFIMTKGGSEPLINAWFAHAGCTPNIKHTALQLTSILGMIRAGMGVSIIANMAVPESHPQVICIPISPAQPRTICLIKTHSEFYSHTAKRAWQLLQRHQRLL